MKMINRYLKRIIQNSNFSILSLLLTSICVSFLYIFFEWLFTVTKPSFMSLITSQEKFYILLYSIPFLSIITIIILIPLLLLKIFVKNEKARVYINLSALVFPSFILASMVMLLIDNFTYTLLKFGIVTSSGVVRLIYLIGFILLFIFLFRDLGKFTKFIDLKIIGKKQSRRFLVLLPILFVIVSLFTPLKYIFSNTSDTQSEENASISSKPNIFIFTCESCDADHFSLYGYERETTPFIDELSNESLVAMNAFSNAQGTTGAVTSILTGKYPTDTRVIYAPSILTGEDAYQHLPGILKSYGYYTTQLSFNWYADAYDLNFINAFSEANGRYEDTNDFLNIINKFLPTNYAYFLYETENRLMNRLGHIFFIKKMDNPYEQVVEPTTTLGFNDEEKMDDLLSMIDNTQQPLFVHFHWMGTHGPTYYPKTQVFSQGKDLDTQEEHDTDLYDDSVLEFDTAMNNFYNELINRGLEDKSIIIITADHSHNWSKSRLPFLIKFPNSENSNMITINVQHLDIAPTILDYMNITQPDWMPGQSLLTDLEEDREIFISVVGNTDVDELTHKRVIYQPNPPFYQFGKIAVIVYDKWYEINLLKYEWHTGNINDYSGNYPEQDPNHDEVYYFNLILDHMESNGFDVSSLENLVSE